MDMKLEVVVIPVSDVDRAKKFYSEQVGFNVDVDDRIGDTFRNVQLTPAGPGGPWNTFFFFKDPDGNDWAVQEKPMS